MKAPFPWFGGKSRAAPLMLERLGNVPNYVEPFAGSLAVLLNRPEGPGRNETINGCSGRPTGDMETRGNQLALEQMPSGNGSGSLRIVCTRACFPYLRRITLCDADSD